MALASYTSICFMHCYLLFLLFFAYTSDELERHEDYFVNLAIHLLSNYKVCYIIKIFPVDLTQKKKGIYDGT